MTLFREAFHVRRMHTNISRLPIPYRHSHTLLHILEDDRGAESLRPLAGGRRADGKVMLC